MEHKVKISVLMAVYNTDFYQIKRAIDSVLEQSFQDFELIVIDDGSKNDPQHRLLDYVKQHEGKITLLWHQNRGQAQSINRGVSLARGEYITILDADDEYGKDHLWRCLQEMRGSDLIASTTNTIVDHEADYYVPDKHDQSQLIHVDDCILFATLFGRKEVFDRVRFQEKYAADAQFYEHAALQYRVKKVNLRTYVYYRNNPASTCSALKNKTLASAGRAL